jgi:hypothetical protein
VLGLRSMVDVAKACVILDPQVALCDILSIIYNDPGPPRPSL